MPRGVFLLAALAVMLAGCTDGKPTVIDTDNPSATVGVHDPNKGKIIGVVFDDEELPIDGAVVALMTAAGPVDLPGAQDSATTDASGGFALQGIEPGTYALFVVRVGYEDYREEGLQIGAGDTVEVTAMMIRLPSTEPYHWIEPFHGMLSGTATTDPQAGDSWLPLSLGQDYNHAETSLTILRPVTLGGIVGELKWTDQQAAAGDLTLTVYPVHIGGSSDPTAQFIGVTGPSILKGTADSARVLQILERNLGDCGVEAETCTIKILVKGSTGNTNTAVDASFVFQQPFEAHMTTFFHMEPPADFGSFE